MTPAHRWATRTRRGDLLAAAEPITLEEHRQIVRQAQVLIEHLFMHLPLKRVMHAVDRCSGCGCSSATSRPIRTGDSTKR